MGYYSMGKSVTWSQPIRASEHALELLNTKLNAESYNQEAIEGGCGKGLREQVQGKSSKNFHPSIKNYPRTWNYVNLSSRFWSSEFEELYKIGCNPQTVKAKFLGPVQLLFKTDWKKISELVGSISSVISCAVCLVTVIAPGLS